MTAAFLVLVVNLCVSVLTCSLVWHHHRASMVGPGSAVSRITRALADVRGRLDVLERIVLKGGN